MYFCVFAVTWLVFKNYMISKLIFCKFFSPVVKGSLNSLSPALERSVKVWSISYICLYPRLYWVSRKTYYVVNTVIIIGLLVSFCFTLVYTAISQSFSLSFNWIEFNSIQFIKSTRNKHCYIACISGEHISGYTSLNRQ